MKLFSTRIVVLLLILCMVFPVSAFAEQGSQLYATTKTESVTSESDSSVEERYKESEIQESESEKDSPQKDEGKSDKSEFIEDVTTETPSIANKLGSLAKKQPEKDGNSLGYYQYYNESTQQFESQPIPETAIKLSTTGYQSRIGEEGKDTCYVLDKNYAAGLSLDIRGNVNLILMDGCTMDVWSIEVDGDNSIRIYAQEKGTGTLNAINRRWYDQNDPGNAGIGSSAHGLVYRNSGSIFIYGGKITAKGGPNAAGIGGSGNQEINASSGNITIRGGDIKAFGGTGWSGGCGAGIGGGNNGHATNITISGGTIHARSIRHASWESSAAIGCGGNDNFGGHFDNITISGGTIIAESSGTGAAIGGGFKTDGGARNINITGGHITANSDVHRIGDRKGRDCSAAIGGGYESKGINISISGNDTEITAIGAANTAIGIPNGNANITISNNLECKAGSDLNNLEEYDDSVSAVKGNKAATLKARKPQSPVEYVNEKGEIAKCEHYQKIESGMKTWNDKRAYTQGWYVVDNNVNIDANQYVDVEGNVKVILKDGCTLNVYRILLRDPNASLKIYSQTGNTGSLNTETIVGTAEEGGQFIGIYGGKINATGTTGYPHHDYPGIGFCAPFYNKNNTIEINRAEVTATGTDCYPGIGGNDSNNMRIMIRGGTVKATGKDDVPGIGVTGGSDNLIDITGGDIVAGSGDAGVGIGAVKSSNIKQINISILSGNSGKIKASGKKAIGLRDEDASDKIKFSPHKYKVLVGETEEDALNSPYVPKSMIADQVQKNKVALINCDRRMLPVSYVNEKGENATCAHYQWIDVDTTVLDDKDAASQGWYVVGQDVDLNALQINGDVKVILINDNTLTVNGRIALDSNNVGLTVYGQQGNTGKIKAFSISGSNANEAKIGLYGGQIQVTGSIAYPGIGFKGGENNNVAINQAAVTASGHPGIGGSNTKKTKITIDGGTVTATGYFNVAGIGFSQGSDNVIDITGGTVTANGYDDGVGIGFDNTSKNGTINLEGGNIVAQGGNHAVGIGAVNASNIDQINIQIHSGKSGKVKAFGQKAIGLRNEDTSDKIVFPTAPYPHNYKVLAGETEEDALKDGYVSDSKIVEQVQHNKVALINYDTGLKIDYIDADGSTKTREGYRVISHGDKLLKHELDYVDGWYVVKGKVRLDDKLVVDGLVKIILTDGAELIASKGIAVHELSTLTIYGQKEQSGKITATGWHGSAIGNEYVREKRATALIINGGIIDARPMWNSDGYPTIGFAGGEKNRITINRGKILSAVGQGGMNNGSVGIGFMNTQNSEFVINNGDIEISGYSWSLSPGSPGIGDVNGSKNKITFNGGNVKAQGANRAPGIGVVNGQDIGFTFDNGCSVQAEGGSQAPGIGVMGGKNISFNFKRGDIRAKSGNNAVGFGESAGGQLGSVTVSYAKLAVEGSEMFNAFGSMDHTDIGDVLKIDGNVLVGATEEAALSSSYVKADAVKKAVQSNKWALINYESGKKDGVPYIDADGSQKECTNYNDLIKTECALSDDKAEGWYVLKEDQDYQEPIKIKGNVKIILEDGCTLVNPHGIQLSNNSTLTIYGQENQTGRIVVYRKYGTAIGFGDNPRIYNAALIINGGMIDAQTDDVSYPCIGFYHGSNDRIEINRGKVSAWNKARGLAIGIGFEANHAITINGGDITAQADYDIAIGFNMASRSVLTINGGNVSAVSKDSSMDDQGRPVIGFGWGNQNNNRLIINGGNIRTEAQCGIGIGSEEITDLHELTINGGKIIAIGTSKAIGCAMGDISGKMTIKPQKVLVGQTEEEALRASYVEPARVKSAVQSEKVALINYDRVPESVTDKPIEDYREMAQITVAPELEDSVQADAKTVSAGITKNNSAGITKNNSAGITKNNSTNVWIIVAALGGLAIVIASLVLYRKRKR